MPRLTVARALRKGAGAARGGDGGDDVPAGTATLEEEQQLVQKITKRNKPYWIAGHDSTKEGTWMFEKTPMKYTNWDRGQPANDGRDEDCIFMMGGSHGKWHDASCKPHEAKHRYVCKRKANRVKAAMWPEKLEYWVNSYAKNWSDAEEACKAQNGTLAAMKNEAD